MRWWVEVLRRGFRRHSTYRGAAFAGVVTNTVFGFVKAYVLLEVYRHNPDAGGWDIREALTWVFMTQAMIAPRDTWYRELDIGARVRSGDIALDFHRPVDLQAYWLAEDLGRAGFAFLGRGLPMVVVGVASFGMVVPAGLGHWVATGVSLFLAIVVSFGVRFIVQLTTFWLLDERGVRSASVLFDNLLGGLAVPLVLMPGWLESLARLTPFPASMQVPIEVWMGRPAGGSLAAALAGQALWALGLLVTGRLVMRAAHQRLVVQGG